MKQIDITKINPVNRIHSVFETFDSLSIGEEMELVSNHDPKGLISLFKRERPFAYDWNSVKQGPDSWVVLIKKTEDLDLNDQDSDGDCCGCCGKN